MTMPASPVRQVLDMLRTSPLFAVTLMLTLAMAAFNGVMVALMAVGLGDLLPGMFAQMTHFTEPHHRTHDLAFGFLFLPAVVGVLAQFRRPSQNTAGMLMALIPTGALLLTLILTLALMGNANVLQPPWVTVAAGALVATGLHPAGRDFFRSFHLDRANPIMLGLVVVAAGPLLVYAATNIRLQGTVTDDHAVMGHYGFMAALGFTVIATGLLASLRPGGWRPVAWATGLLPTLLGITSVIYPDATSSLGLPWALAAMAWGVAFVAMAELARPKVDTGPEDADPTPRLASSG